MLRSVYQAILQKFEFSDDNDRATPWHKESPPKSSVENENAKVLWNIPIHQGIPPKESANKPDIVVHAAKQFIVFEESVCNVGEIHDRDQREKREIYGLKT